jgi:hypothetical protein
MRIPVSVPSDTEELANLIIQLGQEFEEVVREIGDDPPTADQSEWFNGLSLEHARLTRIYSERMEAAGMRSPTGGRPAY